MEIVVIRFRCRGRGPRTPKSRTFSVLPADVVPRRRWSLPWMLAVAWWCSDSLKAGFDQLTAAGMTVEARQLARVLRVLGVVCERLHEHPVEGVELSPLGSRRQQAAELRRAFLSWEASGRGPPASLVLAWNQQVGKLLFAVRLG